MAMTTAKEAAIEDGATTESGSGEEFSFLENKKRQDSR